MVREGNSIRRLIVMVLVIFLVYSGPMSIVSAEEVVHTDVKIKVNGELIKMTEPTFIVEGRIYVPVARVAEAFGAKFSWDNKNEELTLHTGLKDEIVFGNEVPIVYVNEVRYWMDNHPFMSKGRLYVPLRQLAELLHATVNVSAVTDVIELVSEKPVSTETEEETEAELKKAIPSILNKPAESFTDAELKLLAKITMVEAGNESYEGQLALANVILNRVKDSRFPDSIREVIYSGRQFPPAHNGQLDKSKPHSIALRAAKDALNGKNNVENAIYFFNPNVTKGPFWSDLDVIVKIGHHSFAK